MDSAVELIDFNIKKGNFSLSEINLKICKNEIFSIIGKTGAGKTLLLESISGVYRKFSGELLICGVNVLSIPVEQRGIGVVYQDYCLFPHMTVFQNISYGLKMSKVPRAIIKDKVYEISQILLIHNILNCYPGTLSGGECQRTALARALIVNPNILLLDEPFSALDPITKEKMYQLIKDIRQKFDCTIIIITHNFQEAVNLSERIGIIIDGKLIEVRENKKLFYPYQDKRANEFLGITI
ncbi:ATP-binding cassette domain-containing protein [[Clostridium] fimetarium]|uniref:Molybdate transport system ATP-binding protein n=1 Tax=[Clostridium] fimetarium TaxID=99656 RepID=A0A1I0RTZ9_9FIRM|nr:ATP-binding cassette domain-containing protein [[Clostridium] fimetarium]SEW44762.1 molybdate transport system ATP-binding protein [[Clostridium] fimetarium]